MLRSFQSEVKWCSTWSVGFMSSAVDQAHLAHRHRVILQSNTRGSLNHYIYATQKQDLDYIICFYDLMILCLSSPIFSLGVYTKSAIPSTSESTIGLFSQILRYPTNLGYLFILREWSNPFLPYSEAGGLLNLFFSFVIKSGVSFYSLLREGLGFLP